MWEPAQENSDDSSLASTSAPPSVIPALDSNRGWNNFSTDALVQVQDEIVDAFDVVSARIAEVAAEEERSDTPVQRVESRNGDTSVDEFWTHSENETLEDGWHALHAWPGMFLGTRSSLRHSEAAEASLSVPASVPASGARPES